MKPHIKLRSNIRELTTDHARTYEHEKRMEGGTVPGLLQQVRTSIKVSGDRAGHGGSAIPINLPAYTILETINKELRERLQRWNVAPTDKLEGGVHTWAQLSLHTQEQTEIACRITTDWIEAIKHLFEPTRQIEITKPCPSCGIEKIIREVDGENVLTAALIAVESTVTCQCCTASWSGPELHWLASALDTPASALA